MFVKFLITLSISRISLRSESTLEDFPESIDFSSANIANSFATSDISVCNSVLSEEIKLISLEISIIESEFSLGRSKESLLLLPPSKLYACDFPPEGNHKGTHLGISSTARNGTTVNDPSLPTCLSLIKFINGYVGDSG